MRRISLAIGMLAAVAASSASAQSLNLTGAYRCVEACRGGLVGAPTFITQNGPQLNLLNEAGEASRAWPDWFAPATRIWVEKTAMGPSTLRTACWSSSTTARSGIGIWGCLLRRRPGITSSDGPAVAIPPNSKPEVLERLEQRWLRCGLALRLLRHSLGLKGAAAIDYPNGFVTSEFENRPE